VMECPLGPDQPFCNPTVETTEQGKVFIEFQDNDLLIMEGFDDSVIQRMSDVLLNGMPLPAPAAKTGK